MANLINKPSIIYKKKLFLGKIEQQGERIIPMARTIPCKE